MGLRPAERRIARPTPSPNSTAARRHRARTPPGQTPRVRASTRAPAQNRGYGIVDLGDLTRRLGNMPPAASDGAHRGVRRDRPGGGGRSSSRSGRIVRHRHRRSTSRRARALRHRVRHPPSGGDHGGGCSRRTSTQTRRRRRARTAGRRPGHGVASSSRRPRPPSQRLRGRRRARPASRRAPRRSSSAPASSAESCQTDGCVHHLVVLPAVIGAGDTLTVAAGWNLTCSYAHRRRHVAR